MRAVILVSLPRTDQASPLRTILVTSLQLGSNEAQQTLPGSVRLSAYRLARTDSWDSVRSSWQISSWFLTMPMERLRDDEDESSWSLRRLQMMTWSHLRDEMTPRLPPVLVDAVSQTAWACGLLSAEIRTDLTGPVFVLSDACDCCSAIAAVERPLSLSLTRSSSRLGSHAHRPGQFCRAWKDG